MTPRISCTRGRALPFFPVVVGASPRRESALRHSAATFLLSQGFGLEDVKNRLGHSTIVLMARGMDALLGG